MIKLVKKILGFLLKLFLAFIIFTFLFSLKSDLSFGDTIAYFKIFYNKIFNINDLDNANSNNTIISNLNGKHYYYSQLPDTSKIIYSALENNISNLKKENYVIDFGTTFDNLLNSNTGQYKLNTAFQSTLDAFSYDHPELFYIDVTKFSLNTKCISLLSTNTYWVKISPKDGGNYLQNEYKSESEVNVAIKQVETAKNNIIATINKQDTYNKIKEVHDIIIDTLEYSSTSDSTNIRNIYGAFVEKKVVCEGYAKAFKYIMDNLDIDCILVSGVVSTSSGTREAHMWNYINLDGSWYGVDATFDDPIIVGSSSVNSNSFKYNYFLKGYSAFYNSHSATGRLSDTGMLFNIPTLSNNNYKTSSK